MLTLKTAGTLAIIVGCFAVLYPKFLHPITLRIFGLHKKESNGNEGAYSPPHKKSEPKMAGSRPDMRPHMRPGPPPGLRAAAEMERERANQGGGRGMMGVVLPMYAVGIVLYLIYTLVKVFNKREGEERPDDLTEYLNKEPPTVYDTGPLDTEAKMEAFLKQQKTNELEKLLIKADDKNISSVEMRALQKRLEETEDQMTQILKAMQAVSHKVDDVATANPDLKDVLKTAAGTSSPPSGEKLTADNQEGEKSGKSTDSSPDMESFEIVGKKDNNTPSDQSNNTEDDISQSLSSEIENIGHRDSDIKMTESDSTESCAGDKDNFVAPESERDETGADGSEELLPEEDTQHDSSTVRQRNIETSNNN